MLKCRDVLAQGSLYIDGASSVRERFALHGHLLICGHCRRFIRALRLTRATAALMPFAVSEATVLRIVAMLPPKAGQ